MMGEDMRLAALVLEYAGHSVFLHEPKPRTATKASKSNFFIIKKARQIERRRNPQK
jgi:hypothetical protein